MMFKKGQTALEYLLIVVVAIVVVVAVMVFMQNMSGSTVEGGEQVRVHGLMPRDSLQRGFGLFGGTRMRIIT